MAHSWASVFRVWLRRQPSVGGGVHRPNPTVPSLLPEKQSPVVERDAVQLVRVSGERLSIRSSTVGRSCQYSRSQSTSVRAEGDLEQGVSVADERSERNVGAADVDDAHLLVVGPAPSASEPNAWSPSPIPTIARRCPGRDPLLRLGSQPPVPAGAPPSAGADPDLLIVVSVRRRCSRRRRAGRRRRRRRRQGCTATARRRPSPRRRRAGGWAGSPRPRRDRGHPS